MTNFIQKVRDGEIPQPTQRTFNLKLWKAKYDSFDEPGESDKKLYASGLWVFKGLEYIREKLKEVNIHSLDRMTALKAYCSLANRDCNLVGQMLPQSYESGTFIAESVIQGQTKASYAGIQATPDEIIEHTVDSLKYPIFQGLTLHKSWDKANRIIYSDSDFVQKLTAVKILGEYYVFLESIWAGCLWLDHFIDISGEIDIYSQSTLIDKIFTLGMFRYDSLIMQFTTLSCKYWSDLSTKQKKQMLSSRKVVSSFEKVGERYKFQLTSPKVNRTPPISLISEVFATEAYFDTFLDISFKGASHINIRKLIRSWSVLSSLASLCSFSFPHHSDSKLDSKNSLEKYCPIFNTKDLINLLCQALEVERKVSKELITFLTHTGSLSEEPWSKPLVPINGGNLVLLTGPLIYGNILRNIEFWMRAGGIDLGERGPMFELQVRIDLQNAVRTSELLGSYVNVLGESVNIRCSNNVKEELDLVLRIGNKIIIGEIKCILFPTNPLDKYHYFKKLEDATVQVLRKLNNIKQDVQKTLAQFQWNDLCPENVEFVPLVINNLPFATGINYNSVPVVDASLLKRYFSVGELQLLANPLSNESYSTFKFYETKEEAESNIEMYLLAPPQLKIHAQYLKNLCREQVSIDGNKNWVIIHPVVEYPFGGSDYGFADETI